MSVLYISAIAIAIAFCLAFVVLGKTIFAKLSLRFFTLYLCLEALNFGFEWLLVHPTSPYKAAWLGLLMASSFLMAPCVWLFALETNANQPPSLRRITPAQWMVIALGVALTLPLMGAAHSGNLLVDPMRSSQSWLQHIIHETMVAAVVLYLLQVPWYLKRCWQLFETRGRLNQFLFSDIQEPGLHALRCLMWVMAANWCLGLARTLKAMMFGPSPLWDLLFSLAEVSVTLWALYVIFQRCWHYSAGEQELVNSIAIDEVKSTQKYARSALDENARKRIAAKLHELFEREKVHRNSQLKLQDLSQCSGESPHYLSQVINENLGCTFYQLVNRYRIEEAAQLLKTAPEKTVLDIALEVGFNAKSTFNAAFKTQLGVTPSDYRKSNAQ